MKLLNFPQASSGTSVHSAQLCQPFSRQQKRTLHHTAFSLSRHPGQLPFRNFRHEPQKSPQAAIPGSELFTAGIIGRFTRDGHVVRVVLRNAVRGDADELRTLQSRDVPGTAITHARTDAADKLEDSLAQRALEGYARHDPFGNEAFAAEMRLSGSYNRPVKRK